MIMDVVIVVLLIAVLIFMCVVAVKMSKSQSYDALFESQRKQMAESANRQIDLLNQQHARQMEALTAKYEKQNETLRKEMMLQFNVLASDVLRKNSESLKSANSEQIDALLRPLKENIESFRTMVNDGYVKENSSRKLLELQIERLVKLNETIGEEARNLTSALKGNTKVQGDWGEMILETLLENAGLERGINFETQLTRDGSGKVLKNDEGKLLRPDVLIKLPDNHSVIVDSKVSLTAFVDYCNAEDEKVRIIAGKKHLQSVYSHIDELHSKMYQNNLKGASDYVMMFIPNESAYIVAVQLDINLWKYAYDRGVIIVSPTHLFSVMSIVSQLWRQDNQNKNAMLIADRGGKLYDKLVLFLDSFEKVGKSIDDAMTSYHKSFNQLRTGKGNVLRQAEDMKNLGAKASKSLPERLSDSAE
ncbi:MAG: DNA recombination protein RmuC [Bacteroidales bacterium]|nr:DNA recombination protein RmuC [Bacteroidales bacterium]